MATHELKKPHTCHLCKIGFSQRGNLKAHILKVHVPPGENEKVFKCEECSCVYRRLATLNNHIAKIHAIELSGKDNLPIPQQGPSTSSAESAVTPEQANTASIQTQSDSSVPLPSLENFQFHNSSAAAASSGQPEPQRPPTDQNLNQLPLVSDDNIPVHGVNCVYDDSQGTSKRHMVKVKRIGQVKWHLCPLCPKIFRKPSDLIRHSRVHSLERPYSVSHDREHNILNTDLCSNSNYSI